MWVLEDPWDTLLMKETNQVEGRAGHSVSIDDPSVCRAPFLQVFSPPRACARSDLHGSVSCWSPRAARRRQPRPQQATSQDFSTQTEQDCWRSEVSLRPTLDIPTSTRQAHARQGATHRRSTREELCKVLAADVFYKRLIRHWCGALVAMSTSASAQSVNRDFCFSVNLPQSLLNLQYLSYRTIVDAAAHRPLF